MRKRYLDLDHDQYLRIHKSIAELFYQQADPSANFLWLGDNHRAFSELVHHLTQARMWKLLDKTLCNLEFIEKKCKLGMGFDLIGDYLECCQDSSSSTTGSGNNSSGSSSVEEKENAASSSSSSSNYSGLLWKGHEMERERVDEFRKFFTGNVHILSHLPHLTYQQAANSPDTSAPAIVTHDGREKGDNAEPATVAQSCWLVCKRSLLSVSQSE